MINASSFNLPYFGMEFRLVHCEIIRCGRVGIKVLVVDGFYGIILRNI